MMNILPRLEILHLIINMIKIETLLKTRLMLPGRRMWAFQSFMIYRRHLKGGQRARPLCEGDQRDSGIHVLHLRPRG